MTSPDAANSAATSTSGPDADRSHQRRGMRGKPPAVIELPLALQLPVRVVVGPRDPQAVQQHGQLAGDRHDGALLRVLAAARADRLSEPAQIALRTERAQDVLRGADQESAP